MEPLNRFTQQKGKNFVALVKESGQRYLYLFYLHERQQIIDVIHQQVNDPELCLTTTDANCILDKIENADDSTGQQDI